MKRARSDDAVDAAVDAAPLAAPAPPAAGESDEEAERLRVCEQMLALERALCATLSPLAARPPPPITHAYNALEYALAPHELYVRRYGGRTGLAAFFLGMNPGAAPSTRRAVSAFVACC